MYLLYPYIPEIVEIPMDKELVFIWELKNLENVLVKLSYPA
jgi:hypothetical protein